MKYIEGSKEIKDSLNERRRVVSKVFAKFIISLLVREIIANPPLRIFVLFIFCIIFYFLIWEILLTFKFFNLLNFN